MIFSRRVFLQKMASSVGAFTISGFSLGEVFSPRKSRVSSILHLGVNSPKRFFGNNELTSSLVFVTENGHKLHEIGSRPDAVLYDPGLRDRYQFKNSRYGDFLFLNSNISQNREDFVSEFLITQKTGVKVGLIGIVFGVEGQTVSDTIELMNQKAEKLKNVMGCDQVYCLVGDPSLVFPFFNKRKLVEDSEGIDQFYTTSSKGHAHEFYAYFNREGKQVMLSVRSESDPRDSVISLGNGCFSGYYRN